MISDQGLPRREEAHLNTLVSLSEVVVGLYAAVIALDHDDSSPSDRAKHLRELGVKISEMNGNLRSYLETYAHEQS